MGYGPGPYGLVKSTGTEEDTKSGGRTAKSRRFGGASRKKIDWNWFRESPGLMVWYLEYGDFFKIFGHRSTVVGKIFFHM